MNTIEAKIFLLQSPGVNKVRDKDGNEWWANRNGDFEGTCTDEMKNQAPFTKAEPEKTNRDIANRILVGRSSLHQDFERLLDAVDEKIRKAK